MTWENYYLPSSAGEVLELLDSYHGGARLIAGGTDLMVQHRQDPLEVQALVDISGVSEFSTIREENGRIYVGAAVTHSQLEESPLIKQKGSVLAQAARTVGSPQIRNMGTLGGNVVNAQPAADTAIALLALDACVHVLTSQGETEKSLEDTFIGPGESAVDSTREVVKAFSFAATETTQKSVFMRFARRQALALPVINLGIWIQHKEPHHLQDVRIAAGPMSRVPLRARETEKMLRGNPLEEAVLEQAVQTITKEVTPRDSFRGGSSYKKKLVGVFLRRALLEAMEEKGVEQNG